MYRNNARQFGSTSPSAPSATPSTPTASTTFPRPRPRPPPGVGEDEVWSELSGPGEGEYRVEVGALESVQRTGLLFRLPPILNQCLAGTTHIRAAESRQRVAVVAI